MRRILALLLSLVLLAGPARADNYAATAGSGLTFAAKSIGGVLYPWWIPANSSGTELFTSGNAAYVQFPSAQAVTGTFYQATQPVSLASAQVASGAIASGAFASGALSSGSVASGAFASGSIASGAIVSGGDVTEGTTADTTVYAGSGGCTVVACLKGIYAGVTGAIPAGSALIGSIQQYIGSGVVSTTNGGYTNLLQGNAVIATGNPIFAQLTAGSAIAGKVGIDQTTDGTTNGVHLVAGANIAGKFGIDQTTPGTTNNVTITPNTLALGATWVHGTTAAMTGTSSTQVVAAVASNRLYITRIKCNNSSATSTLVTIQDGSAGTALDTLAAGASYGGEQGTGSTPLFWTTSGNGLYAADVTTGASVICTASGYSG